MESSALKNFNMELLFIEAKQKNLNIELDKKELKKLPKKLFLAYSIQYKETAGKIKKLLEKDNIKTIRFQQVLGCSKIKTKIPVLLISTGRFHAINLFLQAPSVYVLENNKIRKIEEQEIEKIRARKRTALIKFLKAEKIGILVSTKPGQENLAKALKLKQELIKKGKRVFIFLSDNINTNQFENFPIDSWVNTACPGLSEDNLGIINIDDLPEL